MVESIIFTEEETDSHISNKKKMCDDLCEILEKRSNKRTIQVCVDLKYVQMHLRQPKVHSN